MHITLGVMCLVLLFEHGCFNHFLQVALCSKTVFSVSSVLVRHIVGGSINLLPIKEVLIHDQVVLVWLGISLAGGWYLQLSFSSFACVFWVCGISEC